MLYQQGDVILKKIPEVKGTKLPHLVLSKGETTGHCHEVINGDAELYEFVDGVLYLKVISDSAEITHPEHRSITLPSGNWRVTQVREYDHFSEKARPVDD